MKKSLKVDTSHVHDSDVSEIMEATEQQQKSLPNKQESLIEEKEEREVSKLKIKESVRTNTKAGESSVKNSQNQHIKSKQTITESDKKPQFQAKATKPQKLEYWDKRQDSQDEIPIIELKAYLDDQQDEDQEQSQVQLPKGPENDSPSAAALHSQSKPKSISAQAARPTHISPQAAGSLVTNKSKLNNVLQNEKQQVPRNSSGREALAIENEEEEDVIVPSWVQQTRTHKNNSLQSSAVEEEFPNPLLKPPTQSATIVLASQINKQQEEVKKDKQMMQEQQETKVELPLDSDSDSDDSDYKGRNTNTMRSRKVVVQPETARSEAHALETDDDRLLGKPISMEEWTTQRTLNKELVKVPSRPTSPKRHTIKEVLTSGSEAVGVQQSKNAIKSSHNSRASSSLAGKKEGDSKLLLFKDRQNQSLETMSNDGGDTETNQYGLTDRVTLNTHHDQNSVELAQIAKNLEKRQNAIQSTTPENPQIILPVQKRNASQFGGNRQRSSNQSWGVLGSGSYHSRQNSREQLNRRPHGSQMSQLSLPLGMTTPQSRNNRVANLDQFQSPSVVSDFQYEVEQIIKRERIPTYEEVSQRGPFFGVEFESILKAQPIPTGPQQSAAAGGTFEQEVGFQTERKGSTQQGMINLPQAQAPQIKSWPQDAEDGFLSYSKMKFEQNRAHPRLIRATFHSKEQEEEAEGQDFDSSCNSLDDINDLSQFPVCGTSTGWFCPLKYFQRSHVYDELGLGINIYLKQIKFLVCLLLLCTLLSIPTFYLFWMGNRSEASEAEIQSFSLNSLRIALSSLSLANLSEKQKDQIVLPIDGTVQTVSLDCFTAQIAELPFYGVATPDSFSVTGRDSTLTCEREKQDFFNKFCKGQRQCNLNVDLGKRALQGCKIEPQSQFFIDYKCDLGSITLSNGWKLPRNQLLLIVIGADILILVCFLIGKSTLTSYIMREGFLMDRYSLQTSDFSVKVTNMPPLDEYQTLEHLRAMLGIHCKNVVYYERQVIHRLRNSQNMPEDIVSIHFTQKDFTAYKILIEIEKLARKGQKLRVLQLRATSAYGYNKYEKIIDKLKKKIDMKARQYRVLDLSKTEGAVKNAFITFRSMEGAARFKQAYNMNKLQRLWVTVCCCCADKESFYRKLFHGRFLQVESAMEPSLIMWEHQGTTKFQRFFRIIASFFMSAALLVIAISAILYLKGFEETRTGDLPTLFCNAQGAQAGIIQPEDVLNGLKFGDMHPMYCFCNQIFEESLAEGNVPLRQILYQFDDGQRHCTSWFLQFSQTYSLILGVPLIIIVVNWLTKMALRSLARFEKHQSKPEEARASALTMFMLSFVNTGVVVQLVNLRTKSGFWTAWLEETPVDNVLVEGRYSEMSMEWYRDVGTTVVITYLLIGIAPHIANLLLQGAYSCRRCCDRKCTCDQRKTCKLAQSEYEDMNRGSEFLIEYRYANMLTLLSVCFLYSPGMPIMYPIGAFAFFLTYWTDKCMLLKCNRKPPVFDSYLAMQTLKVLKYIFAMHLIGFFLMFVYTPVFSLQETFQFFEDRQDFLKRGVQNMYILGGVLVILSCLVYTLCIKPCFNYIKITCCSSEEKHANDLQQLSTNFYECVNFDTLAREFNETQRQLTVYQAMLDSQNFDPDFLSRADLDEWKLMLYSKRHHCGTQMQQMAAETSLGPKQFKTMKAMMQALEMLDRKGELPLSRIRSRIQSYDLLVNEKYQRLDDLKQSLDKQKLQASRHLV